MLGFNGIVGYPSKVIIILHQSALTPFFVVLDKAYCADILCKELMMVPNLYSIGRPAAKK